MSAPSASRRSIRSRGTLSRQLTWTLALTAIVPLVGASGLLTYRSAAQRLSAASLGLAETAAAVCVATEGHLRAHRVAVEALAVSVAAIPAEARERLSAELAAFHQLHPAFLAVLAADGTGRRTGAHPLVGIDGRAVLDAGGGVADRPYFAAAMSEGRTFVSEAHRGRAFGARPTDPIVALSAPVRGGDGRPVGVVTGSLDLQSFRHVGERFVSAEGVRFVLVDGMGSVVHAAPDMGVATLDEIRAHDELGRAFDAGADASEPPSAWREAVAALVPGTQERSQLVSRCTSGDGWTVLATLPLATLRRDVARQFQLAAAWTLMAGLLAAAMAVVVARRLARPLAHVSRALESFDLADAGSSPPPLPELERGMPREIAQVAERFGRMAQRVREGEARLRASLAESIALRGELERAVAEREQRIGERTAELNAYTRELTDANARLERLVDTDRLTGVASRRAFDVAANRAWRMAARTREPLCLLLLDVDHFKSYNDAAGHLAGDDCLRAVAQAIADVPRRPLDCVARYGGEEFVALLYGAPAEAGQLLAERMRAAVEALCAAHPGRPGERVTVSVGMASTVPTGGHAIDTLLAAADRALYAAKAGGRNCVRLEPTAAGERAPALQPVG